MFDYANKANIPWEWPEYQPVTKYESPKERERPTPTATKKGFYMDYMLKIAGGVPSSQHYPDPRMWSARGKANKTPDSSLKKFTYIDLL